MDIGPAVESEPEVPARRPDGVGRAHLLAIAAFALLVRAAMVLGSTSGAPLAGDQVYYSVQAHLNAKGKWFVQPFAEHLPGADHPPLTSLVLTPITFLFRSGDFVSAQRWFTVVVGVLDVVLLTLLASRIVGRRAALVAGVLAAVHAAWWMGDSLVLSEPYAIAAVLGLLLAALRFRDAPSMKRAAVVGVAAGATILGRPEMALLLPLVVVPVGWQSWRRERSITLRSAAVAAMVAAVIVVPWVGWNLSRFEERVVVSSNDGFTLLGANCPSTYFGSLVGGYDIRCALEPVIPDGYDSSQASKLRTDIAVSYAREHVGRLPLVAAARVARVWLVFGVDDEVRGGPGEGRPEWAMWIGVVQYWLLVPFAVVGWSSVDRRDRRLLVAVPVVVTIAAALIAGYWRVRVTADLSLMVLAAAGVLRVFTSVGARRKRRASTVLPDVVRQREPGTRTGMASGRDE